MWGATGNWTPVGILDNSCAWGDMPEAGAEGGMLSYRFYTPGTQPGWQLVKYLLWLVSWLVPG